jgi:hypothetical protein
MSFAGSVLRSALLPIALAGCGNVLGIDDLRFEDACTDALRCEAGTGGLAGAGGTDGGTDGGSDAQPDAAAACDISRGVAAEQPQYCPGYVDNPCSVAMLEAHARPASLEIDGAAGYVVDGDVLVAGLAGLQQYYDEVVTGGALPAIDTPWPAGQKRRLTYCVEASFRQWDFAVDSAAHGAALAWQQLADVRFVHDQSQDADCGRSDSVAFRIAYTSLAVPSLIVPAQADSPPTILVGDLAFHTAALPYLNSRLRHAFGHVLGFRHGAPTTAVCDSADCRAQKAYGSASIMRRGWCAEYSTERLFPAQVDADIASRTYAAPLELVEHDGSLIMRDLVRGELHAWRTTDPEGAWRKIGDETLALASSKSGLFRLDASARLQRYETDGVWRDLGRGAGRIFGCLGTLCASDPETGGLERLSDGQWLPTGELARRYAGNETELVRLTHAGEVERFRSGAPWENIRPAHAGRLYTGPRGVYVTTPESFGEYVDEYLESWDPATRTWTYAAPSGDYTLSGPGLVWIDSASEMAFLYVPELTSAPWQAIGSAGIRITAAGPHLFRIDANGTLWQYGATGWIGRGRP